MKGKNRVKRKHIQSASTLIVLGAALGALSILSWCHKPQELSVSERRRLAKRPSLTVESVLDGSFMSGFERYSQDQFPYRETFRKIKSEALFELYQQKDVHGIFVADGYAAAIESEINEASVAHAVSAFENVYKLYLKNGDHAIYSAIIPDKGYFLAEKYGYPSMDYDEFFEKIKDGMPYAIFIDVVPTLQIDSFYRTDSHWRQEKLVDTANEIKNAMGATGQAIGDGGSGLLGPFTPSPVAHQATDSFYGVYYGQAALSRKPDTIEYIDSDVISQATVYNFETGKTGGVYDWEKLDGNDPYDFFLSGAAALLKIENPNAAEEKKLIVFRDSYGSSLIPLLIDAYSEITVVDIRYVAPKKLGELIDFDSEAGRKADVLFLYGTVLLNDSSTLKE